jgi:hypothetical protein
MKTSRCSSLLKPASLLKAAILLMAAATAFAQEIGTVTPANVTINPGDSQILTFTATFPDHINPEVYVTMTWTGWPMSGCTFAFQWNSGAPAINLADGSGYFSSPAPFVSGTVSNSNCTVTGQSYNLDSSGNLTFSVSVTFPLSMGPWGFGYCEEAVDEGTGQTSDWWSIPGASFNIRPPSLGPPQLGTATPENGSGPANQPVSFAFTAIDPNGWDYSSIHEVDILISPNHSASNACYIVFFPATSAGYLFTDDLTFWNPIFQTPSNSQCQVALTSDAISSDGTTATVGLNLQFFPSFVGTNFIDENITDQWATTGWGTIGAYTVVEHPVF